jgi:preprotein translocase subunit SecE
MMAWKLKENRFYQSVKGRLLLSFVMLFALFIVVVDILQQWGIFGPLIEKYLTF